MTNHVKQILADVQEAIEGVVSDKNVSRGELREFLDEIAGIVAGIEEGLNDDEEREEG